MRIGDQGGPRFFQDRDRELPAHRREVIQEDFQRVTGLQVVEKSVLIGTRVPANTGVPL